MAGVLLRSGKSGSRRSSFPVRRGDLQGGLKMEPLGKGLDLYQMERIFLLTVPPLLGDFAAEIAGMFPIEGLLHAHQQTTLLGVVMDHPRPGHHLQHTEVTAAKMQQSQQAKQQLEKTFQASRWNL